MGIVVARTVHEKKGATGGDVKKASTSKAGASKAGAAKKTSKGK